MEMISVSMASYSAPVTVKQTRAAHELAQGLGDGARALLAPGYPFLCALSLYFYSASSAALRSAQQSLEHFLAQKMSQIEAKLPPSQLLLHCRGFGGSCLRCGVRVQLVRPASRSATGATTEVKHSLLCQHLNIGMLYDAAQPVADSQA